MESRCCADCKEEKPLSEFSPTNKTRTKFAYYCKPCSSRRTVESNRKNKERVNNYRTEYRKKNLEKYLVWEKQAREKQLADNPNFYAENYRKNKERRREWASQWYQANREHYLDLQKKYRAKRKELPPELKEVIKILYQLRKVIRDGEK